jgi:hypothetical protein
LSSANCARKSGKGISCRGSDAGGADSGRVRHTCLDCKRGAAWQPATVMQVTNLMRWPCVQGFQLQRRGPHRTTSLSCTRMLHASTPLLRSAWCSLCTKPTCTSRKGTIGAMSARSKLLRSRVHACTELRHAPRTPQRPACCRSAGDRKSALQPCRRQPQGARSQECRPAKSPATQSLPCRSPPSLQ